MKPSFLALVAGLTVVGAMPTTYSTVDELQERQIETTSNDLKDGPCKDVTFIMARGSTEEGNMVRLDNPAVICVTMYVEVTNTHCP